MTAPTLVMVAPGSRDQRVVRMAHALQAELTRMRPEVAPTVTFMDTCLPRIDKYLRKLHGAGIREAVLVPLDLVHAVEVDPRYDGVVAQAATDLPGLKLQVARPVGPEATLLSVLDLRLRAALAQARVLELDGLILSSPTTGCPASRPSPTARAPRSPRPSRACAPRAGVTSRSDRSS